MPEINTEYKQSDVAGFSGFTVIPSSKENATGDRFSGLSMGNFSPHALYPTIEYNEAGIAEGIRDPKSGKVYRVNSIPPDVTTQDLEKFIANVTKVNTKPPVEAKQADKQVDKPKSLSTVVIKINGIKIPVEVIEGVLSDDSTSLLLLFPKNGQVIELDTPTTNITFSLPTCNLVCSYYGQRFVIKSGDTAVVFLVDQVIGD